LSYVNSRGKTQNPADNFNDNQKFIIGWTNRFGFMAKAKFGMPTGLMPGIKIV
jgi:hypothetical protein